MLRKLDFALIQPAHCSYLNHRKWDSELPTKSVKTELIRGVILQSQPPASFVTMLHASYKVSEPA